MFPAYLLLAALHIPSQLDTTECLVRLRTGAFDPRTAIVRPPAELAAPPASRLLLVQLHPGPIGEFLVQLDALGGKDYGFLPDSARIVWLPPALHERLRSLLQVRWAGPYHPLFKISPELASDRSHLPVVHSIMACERGAAMQTQLSEQINVIGGRVLRTTPEGFRMEAMLTPTQARALAASDLVLYVDQPGPAGLDVNLALQIGGGAFTQQTLGMSGAGVRGEVMDTAIAASHVEFTGHQVLQHGGVFPGDTWHGTRVFGLLFGKGINNPLARGFLPDAQPIFAYLDPFFNNTANRYTHTAELVDPAGPYRAVFQSNSWGHLQTSNYTTVSAEMDDILFLYDLVITQSQSNTGNVNSRQEAWAKNIVSVGGIVHWDTLSRADDCWGCNNTGVIAASTGPASDGRIKPDLAHFYDRTFTTSDSCTTCYEPAFYGTSNASPLVAGHFGLFFQMWHEGEFSGFGGSASVFDSRPHMTTAKAMLINSAFRYDWSAAGPNSDLTRMRQGWGMPDLQKLHVDRDSLFIVDETKILQPQKAAIYQYHVPQGASEFRATLTWADPRGNPAAQFHRINDLTLRVIDSLGQTYWGNNGLTASNWSVPGGAADTINTTENVLLANPPAGTWTIQVIASEINQDGHAQTPQLDADFALVVATSGGNACYANCDGSTAAPVLTANDFQCFLNQFAAANSYANCDGSTGSPALTANDFQCFVIAYATGCP